MRDIIIFDAKTIKMRAVLIAVALFAIGFGLIAIRWQLGDMLAGLTRASDANAAAIADLAVTWAPSDPAAYALKATTSDDTAMSIAALEEAVRRAPNDFRFRTDLGRAYAQDERFNQAEAQLKKAVQLAPSYAAPHWHLANFFLRQERGDEAVAELAKAAAANNHVYREQVFSLAWDYFDRDAARIESLAGERADLFAYLAYFFAARGRSVDALRNWERLSADDKRKNAVMARNIALGLYDQRHFPEALAFSRYGSDMNAAAGAVTNGTFEKAIGDDENARFGWLIVRNDTKLDIAPDASVKHAGGRSMRFTFKGYNKPALANLFQTIVVEPGQRYRVRFWLRTENLKTAGAPMLEIINANDDTTIVRSMPFATGTSDWREIDIEFTAPATCNGISIRTIRAVCGENCPIAGIFWYDDFEFGKF